MKILIVSHEYPPIGGGGGNACMNLVKEFSKAGHKLTVVTVWFQGLPEKEEFENVTIYRLRSERKRKEHCGFAEMADYLWKALLKADRLQRKNRFDICLVFFAIPSGPIGYYLKKRYGLPYVVRFGGGDIPGFQERFKYLYKAMALFERGIWKKADALVANSRGLRKLARRFYDKQEIHIITNGVDRDCFLPAQKKKKTTGEIRILFVSRLIERKGLQFILPMLPQIRERSDREIILTVVGDGPFRGELKKIVSDMHLEEKVVFAGQRDKDELPDYYRDSDIFILPSKKEGMPNVVLEAMSCGLPVVMTPCEGSEELIRDNGFAVPIEGFADKIVLLCRDDILRKKMGEASIKVVKDSFLWEKVAEDYCKLMERIVNE